MMTSSLTKRAEKPRHSCRGGICVGRAGLNAQEPNKTHAVPEPSMGEGTAEREAPAFMPGRTSHHRPPHFHNLLGNGALSEPRIHGSPPALEDQLASQVGHHQHYVLPSMALPSSMS